MQYSWSLHAQQKLEYALAGAMQSRLHTDFSNTTSLSGDYMW